MKPAFLQTRPPDAEESALASEASRTLHQRNAPDPGRRSVLLRTGGGNFPPVEVPASAYRLFLDILDEMAQGRGVVLSPARQEMTTQQAADLANVSRPYVVKLIDNGVIPCRRVGSRRMVKTEDVQEYLEKARSRGAEALDLLAAQAQELQMGY